MSSGETHQYRLADGTTRVRIDADSLDYRWSNWVKTFQGTLPYENLRLNSRVRGRDAESGHSVVFVIAVALLIWPFVPAPRVGLFVSLSLTMILTALYIYVRDRWFSATISVEINPQPFGFYDRLQFPDTPKGRSMLEKVEQAWRASLKRRFLDSESKDPIDWRISRVHAMVDLGVITEEEGEAYRRVLDQTATEADRLPLLTN